MKRLFAAIFLLAAVTFAACSEDPTRSAGGPTPSADGTVTLTGTVTVPDMTVVQTRSVDNDGWGIQSLYAFCFGEGGMFISRVRADVKTAPPVLEGEFTLQIPSSTRIIHFVANANLDNFDDAQNVGSYVTSVIPLLESTSGKMVYWSEYRHEGDFTSGESIHIQMVRNQARIEVRVDESLAGEFETDGFSICNTYANGTVAPFDPVSLTFGWDATAGDGSYPNLYVTLPTNAVKATDAADVDHDQYHYIFEDPNPEGDQTYLIVKGRAVGAPEWSYYKVLFLREDKTPWPIYRNMWYEVVIRKSLASSPAYATFAEAKEGVPVNDVYVAVSPEVPTISDGQRVLTVERTTHLLDGSEGRYTIAYWYCNLDGSTTGLTAPSVSWLSNDRVAQTDMVVNNYDTRTGEGTVEIVPFAAGATARHAELSIRAGALSRTVSLMLVRPFVFTPVWISSGINGSVSDQDVTLVFQIPEDYPQELLPLECRISANEITGTSETPLRLIFQKDYPDEEWGEQTQWPYKYVYEAQTTGTHRIYFRTTRALNDNNSTVLLEAEHFEPVTKRLRVTNDSRMLEFVGLRDYTERIQYALVPKIAGSELTLQFRFVSETGAAVTGDPGTTVRIYTNNLDPAEGQTGMEEMESDPEMEANGRYLRYTPQASDRNGEGVYTLRFRTRVAVSDEPIRIADEHTQYASATMELATYGYFPFHFDVRGEDGTQMISYGPGVPVTVSFDTSGFTSETTEFISPGNAQYTCFIATRNLEPDPAYGDQGLTAVNETGRVGYEYLVTASTQHTFHFVTKEIVSGETVSISSDETISFTSESVTLTNRPIEGVMSYGETSNPGDATVQPVEEDAFVTIERTDGTRIGYFTVGADGRYTLTLRGEYDFEWKTANLTILYSPLNSSERYGAVTSLEALFASPDLVLSKNWTIQ